MAQLLLSSILLILSPLSSPLVIREPLKLTTGVEVEALYVEPSDQFCLSVEDFAIVRSDLERGWEYCERRLEAERLAFFDHIRKLQTNHEAVHESYLKQRDQLKEQLITSQGRGEQSHQRDLVVADRLGRCVICKRVHGSGSARTLSASP